MDKCILEQFSTRMLETWGEDSLAETSTDLLLLTSWVEVLDRTVAIISVDHYHYDLSVSVVVTLDGDEEYCIWESSFLEEAYGTDAWFADKESAIEHAKGLAQQRFLESLSTI